ncbi:O-antigen ligase family protein [Cryobacterium sp. 1639]|uniref:O-antigen ligase family protein n=1 Tax=Cryobacterium inferilacus TaxID=2866629 RepID=UPI001C72B683|nr:O-antigen ligase family protein [Cryobacterium sp. 1639]MBX0299442.1 O-antigen ligase family protein [Cryobacterium sp. 1639]
MRSARPPSPRQETRRSSAGRHGGDAVMMLTIYLVLLLGIPSGVVVTALGALGHPSLMWGLVLLGWWAITRLQLPVSIGRTPISQPVRVAFVVFLVVVLLSFTAAMLRGQPDDQESPAVTALVRMLSWAGVLFVAIDGIRTVHSLARMARRIVIGAGLLAALGLAQFLTGSPLVDFFGSIPGLTAEGGLGERAGIVRSSGTAIHPLEYATALNAALPLVIAAALSRGFRSRQSGGNLAWWLPVCLIAVSALVSVSRSAIIGLALAVILMIPAVPARYRTIVIGAGVGVAFATFALMPGLLSTTVKLFSGAATDPSTQSRTNALERVPEFMSTSPVVGSGFGIFLPRYYIFDNQWVLIAIEVGILGLLAFAAFFVAGIWSALQSRRSTTPDVRLLGHALALSLFTIAILFAFFDGLSFPIAGGMLFLLAGLCGSVRAIVAAEAVSDVSPSARETPGVPVET